ncbi:hypothetical protein Tco_0870244 [Tanacetum coccineum]
MASTQASSSNPSKKIKLTIIPHRKLFVDLTSEEDGTTTPSPITKSSSPSSPNAPSKTQSTKDTSSTFGTTSSSFKSKPQFLPPSSNDTPSPQPSNPFLDDIMDAPPRPTNPYIDSQLREVIADKNAKVADFENQIHSSKLQLSATVESHKTLSTTVDVLKQQSKPKEDKYLEEIIDLEKKKKALDDVVYKMGQSMQTMHIKVPSLYCGNIIFKPHAVLFVTDSDETLIMAEENLVHTVVNTLVTIVDYQNIEKSYLDEYNENLKLQAELSKKNEMVEKDVYDELSKFEQTRELRPLDSDLDSALVISSTSASGSYPPGNTKKNRISRPTSSNKKNKVEDHLRSVKSSLNKNNRVSEPVCNVTVKHSVLNVNSELICATCNECVFDAIHDLYVLDYLNDVNVRAKPKLVKSKKKKVWKPTGKVYTKVGYSWKPTGRTFTIDGNMSPSTRITSTQ